MIFSAKLYVDGGDAIEVLRCSYAMDRDTDRNGQPSTTLRAGKVSFTIKSDSSIEFFEWMVSPYTVKTGYIEFFKHNDPTPAKTLHFNNSFLISHAEDFNVMDGAPDSPMTESFTVSAEELCMNDTCHLNNFSV